MTSTSDKTNALLRFLKDLATLSCKRIPAYGNTDKLLWFYTLPQDLPQAWKDVCRSAFVQDNPTDIPDLWLEVRKKRKPVFPPLPNELKDWIPQKFQNNPEEFLDKNAEELRELINREITDLVERRTPGPNAPAGVARTRNQKAPKIRRLEDHPQVKQAWLDYLANQWSPWVQEMRRWKQVQDVYENVDFMRRRIEEAEERYELLLAVGLLQWRDATGATVKRHLLTAPAEISLDAARGVLTVGPAASFEKFRIELEMLELQERPRLEETDLEDRLEELDVRAWDKASVAKILHIIANQTSADAQVSEEAWEPRERADETFRISYAPALVLRERQSTAYQKLIDGFLESFKNGSLWSTTAPWERLVCEGNPSLGPHNGAPDANYALDHPDARLYFPLPTNEEQRLIAERLRRRPFVLVKGPPGTGKSHTIANLICHLLATGERVLVTAHANKALTVLHELLPKDIRNLCVTAFGSSREDHRLLEESVRGILSRKDQWKGKQSTAVEIDTLENELRQLESKVASVERQFREYREAETYSHTLPGGYSGTAAQIARQIEKQGATYGWLPMLNDDKAPFPLNPEEVVFFADFHTALTPERLTELRREIGSFSLPDPAEFAEQIEKLNLAQAAAKTEQKVLSQGQRKAFERFSDSDLSACLVFLEQLEEQATRVSRVLGNLTDDILKDLLLDQTARWGRLLRETAALWKKMDAARQRAGSVRIDIPSDIPLPKLLADTQRRLEHFQKGGWRGWGPLAPGVVRQTRYIEECCRVDGEVPCQQDALDKLVGFLELTQLLERFHALWPADSPTKLRDPRDVAEDVKDMVLQLHRLLEFFKSCDRKALQIVPIEQIINLTERDERASWCRMIKAELTLRREYQARAPLEAWRSEILGLDQKEAHACMHELEQAIRTRDRTKWDAAWKTRERVKTERVRLKRYLGMLDLVSQACPGLTHLIKSTQGEPEWNERLRQLGQAWYWAAAKAWLRKVTDPQHSERLSEQRHRLQKKIENKLEKLVTLKAWQAFFQRLDDQTEQYLTAWAEAVRRIGKGTGKHAGRHRRTARQYLMQCIPKMPAWIMPLQKLWDTIDPLPGAFDTVIVDEASQAGIQTLVLLLLAKRIIVVGDDKQNSPEAVGVSDDDIARLARDHLKDFRFRDEFRPDTSLYDHAHRAFGNFISLREHFRCVPEIIRFSNELCYSEAPLIPLRQPPLKRLPPLQAEFVEQGFCSGQDQRLSNEAEVEAIVKKIQACLDDKAYEGKTMGVIVLQGRVQAELIEKRIAEALEAKAREERKLRCGVPATFQGDQRDVIFLSLVIAPNHNFRALTGLPDQRRFNVAMSRARDHVWLFHSVQLHDLSREDLRWRLLDFFHSPCRAELDEHYVKLDLLEREVNRRLRQRGDQPEPYESWFEVDVALQLLRKKYRIRPQVNVAGYRIDLVIEGSVHRLALECDGEAWHGPDKFEQDMARQRQLERAGWKFVRIRESEFYTNQENAVRRIVRACEELDIRPIGEEEPQSDVEVESAASASVVEPWPWRDEHEHEPRKSGQR